MSLARQAAQPVTEEEDAWSTGSGMPDKFIGYIDEPFFGVDEKYHADAMLFQCNLVDETGEPVTTIKYSVGDGWEASSDGSTITHPSKTKVNNSSRFGYFIDRLASPKTERAPKSNRVTPLPGKDKGLGIRDILIKRGNPTIAASFVGLGFFWEQHKMETMGVDAETNKPNVKDTLLPTEYIGTWEEREGAVKTSGTGRSARPGRPVGAAPAATPRAAAPAAATAEAGEDVDLPIALRKKLTSKAQSSTAKEFLKSAARDPEVIALDEAAMSHVLSGGADGFWQSVQPE